MRRLDGRRLDVQLLRRLLVEVLLGGVVMVTVVVPPPPLPPKFPDDIDSLCSLCAFRRRLYGVKRRTGPDAAATKPKIMLALTDPKADEGLFKGARLKIAGTHWHRHHNTSSMYSW